MDSQMKDGTGNPSRADNPQSEAVEGSAAILDSYERYKNEFNAITRRAQSRFEKRNWKGGRRDAMERLDLYQNIIAAIVEEIEKILGDRAQDKSIWKIMKGEYSLRLEKRNDARFAETFYNSVTRKIFSTVGIDREIEFVLSDIEDQSAESSEELPVFSEFDSCQKTREMTRKILDHFCFEEVDYEDIERDVRRVSREIDLHLWPITSSEEKYRIEANRTLFYRNKAAYIIGRITTESHVIPLVVPLLNGSSGVYVDAVILNEDEVSIIFGFTRSYFSVEVDRPDELIDFLRSILPEKPLAELHISIGFNKHGKTEFYSDLHGFLHETKEMFMIAPGEKGKVMVVLTLPGFDYVFKIIKDRPDYPKTITRREVMEKYALVDRHDRVGRMVDNQEFEHLSFKRERFPDELLDELLEVAQDTVTVRGEHVDIQHLYVERKVIPLPIYLKEEKRPEAIRHAIVDVGYCVKDQAAAGIFVGDLRIPNFGVTRLGRVVFFDYDEIDLLTDLEFRTKPEPRDELEDIMADEDRIYARSNDVFIEEIEHFIGIPHRGLRDIFREVHDDLFTLAYWHQMQVVQRDGLIVDTIPYDRYKRFPRR